MTLQEVADHAGVSIATVSRVARGIGHVAPSTRARVAAAIAELGFRPSHLGRALASRRHGALGVVLPGLSGPYHSEVIAGFEQEAIVSRLSVLILGTHLLSEARDLVLDMADRVDGIAVLGGSIPDDVVDELLTRDCPVVQLAGRHRSGMLTVRTESVEAVRTLTRHLLVDHGYERLAFVGNPTGSPDAEARWHGFRLAHRDAGLLQPLGAIRVGHDQPGGMIAAKTLFAADRPPRAVVCVNDETALGILVSALSRGLSVPGDVAITGFDDVPAAELTTPNLTTVRQPMRELGRRTVLALQGAIDGELTLDADEVLPSEVIIRASCGCAPPPAVPDANTTT